MIRKVKFLKDILYHQDVKLQPQSLIIKINTRKAYILGKTLLELTYTYNFRAPKDKKLPIIKKKIQESIIENILQVNMG